MTFSAGPEHIFFDDAGVLVSSRRLVTRGTSYDMRIVAGVRCGPVSPSPIAVNAAVGLFGLAGLYAVATYLFVATGACGDANTGQNGALIVAGLVFVAVLLILQQRSVTRGLVGVYVALPTGEVMVAAGNNPAWIARLSQAIEAAISA